MAKRVAVMSVLVLLLAVVVRGATDEEIAGALAYFHTDKMWQLPCPMKGRLL